MAMDETIKGTMKPSMTGKANALPIETLKGTMKPSMTGAIAGIKRVSIGGDKDVNLNLNEEDKAEMKRSLSGIKRQSIRNGNSGSKRSKRKSKARSIGNDVSDKKEIPVKSISIEEAKKETSVKRKSIGGPVVDELIQGGKDSPQESDWSGDEDVDVTLEEEESSGYGTD